LSKKPAALKVHQLAKELGVSSKDVVARCQAEEIPDIVNHLSPVSAGLALTVREWFAGSAEDASTVAVAAVAAPVAKPAKAAKADSTEGTPTRTIARRAKKRTPADGESDDAKPEKASKPRASRSKTADAGPASDAATTAEAPTESAAPAPASTAGARTDSPAAGDSGAVTSGDATTVEAPAASSGTAPKPVAPKLPEAEPSSAKPVAPAEKARSARPRLIAGLSARPTLRPDATSDASTDTAQDGTAGTGAEPPAPARRVITAPPPPPASLAKPSDQAPVMNVPQRPKIVGPVGPQLGSLEKTKLAGPQVIRVEQAENLPTPPPMRRTGPGGGFGTAGGARTGRPGFTGGGTAPRGRGGIGASRMGRAGDSARTGFGAQDLRDRQARLDGSSGFMKSHRSRPGQGRGAGGFGAGGQSRPERKPGEVQQVHVSEPLTIKELSAATGVKAVDIIKRLFLTGTMATINSAIDREKAIETMMEFEIDLVVDEAKSAAEIIEERFAERERLDERRRAPIVTILGHVDHGKTSLLDRIRSTNIAEGEAGGITQSTRAFTVPVKAGDVDRVVTFIDTPGHEAFTNMRARGAKVTDIVVLVVSAVDGVMPQTVESINHAKAAGVPIVVALNKIDRPDATEANVQRALGQLAEHELNPVEWGGTTEVVRTSATRGDGIQQLLELLDYHAELLELKADFKGNARGTVLEASVEEGRGPVARVLIQEGCLKKGDFVVIGRGYGRVRDIVNDRGERVAEALPSTPVAISGIDELPDAGDKAFVVASLRAAEEAAEERRRIDRERELAAPKITLDNIFKHLEKQGRKELALVVKADVQGSVEALKGMLAKLPTEEVTVSVKSASAGGINEGDVTLAAATNAIIVGFNVTSSGKARQIAETKGIEIRLYEVIYDLIDDVVKAAKGMLEPELKLEVLGHAEVRQVFRISKVGAVAGCYVTDGVVERNAQIRVTRDGIVVEKDRRLEQLKRFKDDAKEVRAGQECGMKIVGYDDIKVGDVLECYKTVEVRRD
jgi:translation initiation factor IF-2